MKILHWLDENLEETLLLLLLLLMTLLMGTQVVFRYLFNHSLSWSEELTRYLFIWAGFISIPYCIRKWISIKVDQIINMLPISWYVVFQFILNVILFLFFVYVAFHAFHYLQMSIASSQTSPALKVPMYYIHAAPLCGFSLAMIRSFQQIVLEFKNMRLLVAHKEIVDRRKF